MASNLNKLEEEYAALEGEMAAEGVSDAKFAAMEERLTNVGKRRNAEVNESQTCAPTL